MLPAVIAEARDRAAIGKTKKLGLENWDLRSFDYFSVLQIWVLIYSTQRNYLAMTYLVSYDLHGPNRDYSEIEKPLLAMDGKKVLQSTWVLNTDFAAATLGNKLLQHLRTGNTEPEENDRLLIVHVGVDHSWHNLFCDDAEAKSIVDGF